MRYQDLSAEDQKLLNTDLGDFDKVAAAEVALAQEMYNTGFEKLATETADYLDSMFEKVAEEEEKEDEKEEEDEETKKAAADLGAFIERGFFDGLRKLGAERHGDETIYLLPYLEEKIAEGGARAALGKFWGKMKGYGASAGEKAKELGGKVKEKALEAGAKAKEYGQKAKEETVKYHRSIPAGFKKGYGQLQKKQYSAAAKSMGVAAAKTLPHAGALGAGGLGYLALRKKKDEGQE